MRKPLSYAIGIPCYNEAQNIGSLLKRLSRDFSSSNPPLRIIVVSSGSADGTDEIVRDASRKSLIPIDLITEQQRLGKSRAVNAIINAASDVEVIVLISADVLPAAGCLERLLSSFEDPTVGVAGGRPVPLGPKDNLAYKLSCLLWSMHHHIAMRKPKTTEVTLFRNMGRLLQEDSLVDEAELEAFLSSRGFRVAYVPDALITLQAPTTIRDYITQRIRVTRGHLLLRSRSGYAVGTLSILQRLQAILQLQKPERPTPFTLLVAAILETHIFIVAWLQNKWTKNSSGIWTVCRSTKREFAAD